MVPPAPAPPCQCLQHRRRLPLSWLYLPLCLMEKLPARTSYHRQWLPPFSSIPGAGQKGHSYVVAQASVALSIPMLHPLSLPSPTPASMPPIPTSVVASGVESRKTKKNNLSSSPPLLSRRNEFLYFLLNLLYHARTP
jgi:hypothetical protein